MKAIDKIRRMAVAAAVMSMLLLSLPASMAQEKRDENRTTKGKQEHMGRMAGEHNAAGRPGAMAGGREHMGQMGRGTAAGGQQGLLANPDVKVEVIPGDKGVTVLVTSDKEDVAKQIKDQLPAQANMFKNMGRGMRDRQGGDRGAGGYNPDKVKVETELAANGAAIIISSDDAQHVEIIKRMVPMQIEMMKRMAQRLGELRGRLSNFRDAGEFFGVLMSDKVTLAVEEQEGSVILKVTPNDPAELPEIKALLEERLNNLKELRERMQERRGEGRVPGWGDPEGRPMPPGTPGGGAEGQGMRPGGRRPVDPETREMIREEIRKYLEEKEKNQ